MSCSENFKGMLALTYSKQSFNMSKHNENTNSDYFTETASNQDTAKEHLLTHNGGTGPELS